jgi:hypothetical protein
MKCNRQISGSFASLRLCVRLSLITALLVTVRPVTARNSVANEPLRLACQYLWSQQADDGGWHSEQYAVLRSGQALTPFVLHTLLEVPESICPRPADGVRRALEFIRKHVDEQGAIGRADPDIIEYPVYSTAYALQCLMKVRGVPTFWQDHDGQLTSNMYHFLSTAQFDEQHGFDTNDPAYGGWGFDVAREDGKPGHMDLAHTRRALQALRAIIPNRGYPQFTRGELFLRVVQRHPGALARPATVGRFLHYSSAIPFDGGFYFSPVVDDANKGRFSASHEGAAAPHFRSYATATCDGVLALLACGVARDDKRVACAIEWLENHGDLDYPDGVPKDHPEPWGEAIRFYHYAVRAEVYGALDWPGDWRRKISVAVGKQQAENGSFRNTASALMKEDDPLLCTSLAVVAMAHCLTHEAADSR